VPTLPDPSTVAARAARRAAEPASPSRSDGAEANTASPLTVGAEVIAPGTKCRFEVPFARLPTGTWLSLPVIALNGRLPGPRLWLSAAIHGDEINGIEIVRRVVETVSPRGLRGAIIAVPVVNVYGFINETRYLPDRRDLNRHFPGSDRGSLAARMAALFLDTVVTQCDYGIDLHTGSDHRYNVPHVRGDFEDPATRRIAEAFGTRYLVQAKTRDGSLREAARSRGIPVLAFEGGQVHRYDEEAIDAGVNGVLGVLAELGMRRRRRAAPLEPPELLRATSWLRAKRSGLFRAVVKPGEAIVEGQEVGRLADSLGRADRRITSAVSGVVIGLNLNPLVHRGDALLNVGVREPRGGVKRLENQPK
jgi:uncharacterized protein